MGALILGWISSKAMFVIGITVVALAAMAYLWGGRGLGRMLGLGEGYGNGYSHHQRISNAYAAHTRDTDPDQILSMVVRMLTQATSDVDQLHSNMSEITAQVQGALQPSGPLYNLIQEREHGTITPGMFHQKLQDFVRQLGVTNSVPLNEIRIIRAMPAQVRQLSNSTANLSLRDKIQWLQNLKQTYKTHYNIDIDADGKISNAIARVQAATGQI